ncbi:MAG TPA: hypothetical protein VHY91_02960 [Pirellulales bacterium]|nr:hypothetical protein [Pirellulales bacterium]
MSRWRAIAGCVVLLVVAAAAEPRVQPAHISLELFSDQDAGVDSAQRWYQVFTDLGVANLRIRGAEAGDEVAVHEEKKRDAPTYHVTGRITANNVLLLPGGKFTPRDSARLKQWLKNLAEQGADGVTGKPARFGLSELQFQDVQEDLKQPVGFSTVDLPADEAVTKIAGGLRHKLEIAPAARADLAKRHVTENLGGLSAGTALAVILRPAGLAFAPERVAGKVIQYRVGAPAADQDSWPVGWKSDKPDRDLLPDLFKFIHIEIDEAPLVEAVEAIQTRLAIPFLWDHFALESQAIDPAKTLVKLPTKKLHYGLILSKVLSQAKLQKELRVDEAGKPFLWITTQLPPAAGAK